MEHSPPFFAGMSTHICEGRRGSEARGGARLWQLLGCRHVRLLRSTGMPTHRGKIIAVVSHLEEVEPRLPTRGNKGRGCCGHSSGSCSGCGGSSTDTHGA